MLNIPSMQELLEAGVHFGHRVARGHPKMKEFIYGARDGVHIIDLEKTEKNLQKATEAAFELGKQGKTLLIVGTKKQAKEIVEKLAKETDSYYLTERWIGGLLTNFDEVRKNIKKLNDLKEEQQKGLLSRYTKKEQLLISKKLSKFQTVWGGVIEMDRVPDALFVIDAVSDKLAIIEGRKIGAILIGFSDTNADPNWFDFPIPANDDGIKAIKIIAETVIGMYGKGKKSADAKVVIDQEVKTKKVKIKEEKLDTAVAEEALAIEEVVEKKAIEESARKIE